MTENLHETIEKAVRGKYYQFRGEYYLFLDLWSQEGVRGVDSFQTDVFSKEGKYLRTQYVDSTRRRAFELIEKEKLPWLVQNKVQSLTPAQIDVCDLCDMPASSCRACFPADESR